MKVSVSLPEDDLDFLDEYAGKHGQSRSAAVHDAVTVLRSEQLAEAYGDAWRSWAASGDEDAWDTATADGLDG